MTRARLRDLGISVGHLPPGRFNAITDVPGVLVGHCTLIYDEPRVARTGVTVIVPREGKIWTDQAFAGYFSLNGCGEMTGTAWIEEAGLLHTPIAITNTNAVGVVRDALCAFPMEQQGEAGLAAVSASWTGALPVVGETWDGWLNDIAAFHVRKEHVFEALRAAKGESVPEGNVGGGTGMICHELKGGIGTASRLVNLDDARYVLGALVQANYGARHLLRISGVPVGRELSYEKVPSPWSTPPPAAGREGAGSIIGIIATDAPLLPLQCKRLARRAALGLARVGSIASNGSGDLFLAFATGNHLPAGQLRPYALTMLPHDQLDLLFEAAVEAVEEAILNALTAAETLSGWQGRTAYALPLDELQRIMARYR
jgi:D-aminopeptidase